MQSLLFSEGFKHFLDEWQCDSISCVLITCKTDQDCLRWATFLKYEKIRWMQTISLESCHSLYFGYNKVISSGLSAEITGMRQLIAETCSDLLLITLFQKMSQSCTIWPQRCVFAGWIQDSCPTEPIVLLRASIASTSPFTPFFLTHHAMQSTICKERHFTFHARPLVRVSHCHAF